MSSSLVRGRYVICHARDSRDPQVIENGAAFQANGRIEDIGPFAELSRKYDADEVIGDDNSAVFPGFVNAHHHVGLTPFQLGAPDLPLEQWIIRRIGTRSVDLYLDTQYAAFQMVESGITTVQHMHGWVPGSAEDVSQAASSITKAYEQLGMRCSYSYLAGDQCRLVYDDDSAFIATLPHSLQADAAEFVSRLTLSIPDHVALFEDLTARHRASGRVRIQLAPANLHWCSDALLGEIGDLSRKYNVPMHFHLLESLYQREYARRRSGSAVRHLEEFGLLGPNMTPRACRLGDRRGARSHSGLGELHLSQLQFESLRSGLRRCMPSCNAGSSSGLA